MLPPRPELDKTILSKYFESSMAQRSQFRRLNSLMRGNLVRFLAARRARGMSYADISLEIRDEYGVTVTGEAVRQWCRQRGIDNGS